MPCKLYVYSVLFLYRFYLYKLIIDSMLIKSSSYLLYILIFAIFIITILITYFIYYMYSDKPDSKDSKNTDKVCISIEDYNALLLSKSTKEKGAGAVGAAGGSGATATTQDTVDRDRKVLNDQLYPPLNRSDNITHTNLANNINKRNMYINTNDIRDTYRLVGYVTNNSDEKDTGNNNWKLFARQKDRNTSDFYMKPTDNNNDIKVTISDEIVVGGRLRDIYDIPRKITFNSPMLNKESYDIVEVPKADLSRSADYI
jgi:hypothetical protein